MSDKPTVNPQITDAITQANVKVLGDAPAMAMGSVYQALAHSTGILFENTVAAQNAQNAAAQAASSPSVMQIYAIDTVANAVATAQLLTNPIPQAVVQAAPPASPAPTSAVKPKKR